MSDPKDTLKILTTHDLKDRLDSWKEIADYLGKSVRTVQRWEAEEGMPIHRHMHSDRNSVYAWKQEISTWLAGRNLEKLSLDDPLLEGSAAQAKRGPAMPESPARHLLGPTPLIRRPILWLAVALVAIVALTATSMVILSIHSAPTVRLTKYTQLTHDGRWKAGLATDGVWAYYFENGIGTGNLCRVPVAGGDATCAPINLPSAVVTAVSPDGTKVLLKVVDQAGPGATLWVASALGGKARRVGNTNAVDAVWAPAKKIFYTHEFGIWTVNEDGTEPGQFLSTPEAASDLGWSPDGKRLWYTTFHPGLPPDTIWEVNSAGTGAHRIFKEAGEPGRLCCGFWLAQPRSFGFLSSPNNLPALMVEREDAWNPLQRFPAISRTASGLPQVEGFAAVATRNQLIVEAAGPEHEGVYCFRPGKKEFEPFLDGIPAEDLDFSPDRRHVVYVDNYNHSLWRYDLAKRNKAQLISPPFTSSLPRWSPDGRWIYLTGMGNDRQWEIYRIPPEGGVPERVIPQDQNEGAPTWSPDGRSLIFGKIECMWSGDCGVYRYDLAARSLYKLPGSDGLRTARWSPDGRYIAALRPSDGGLMLFDLATRGWKKIYAPVAGDCLCWSRDSAYIYIHNVIGLDHFISRVSVHGGAAEQVADLTGLQVSGDQGWMWFGLTPDGSLLVSPGTGSREIFSINYEIQ